MDPGRGEHLDDDEREAKAASDALDASLAGLEAENRLLEQACAHLAKQRADVAALRLRRDALLKERAEQEVLS